MRGKYDDAYKGGVIDLADGFNAGISGADDSISASLGFTPLTLEVTGAFDASKATFAITYDSSDPAGVTWNSQTGGYDLPAHPGPLRLWKKDAEGVRTKWSPIFTGGDYVAPGVYTAAQLGLTATDWTAELYVEAVKDGGETPRDIRIQVDPDGSTGPAAFAEPVVVQVRPTELKGNMTLDGLSESEETTFGRAIRINNDDDDGDGLLDNVDANGVVGEDDLLVLTLGPISPSIASGEYRLLFTGAHIRMWQNPNRTGAVQSGTTAFNANQATTLYVEGFSNGSDTISLNWFRSGGSPTGTPLSVTVDSIKVNVGRIDLQIAGLSESLETAPGAVIWKNTDFSKLVLAESQPEPDVNLYKVDFVSRDVLDPAYQTDYTPASITIDPGMVGTHQISISVLDDSAASDNIELWSFTYWEGMQSAGPNVWKILPGQLLTPASNTLSFWIEGVDLSFDGTDSLVATALPNSVALGLGAFSDYAFYHVGTVDVAVDGNRDTVLNATNSYDRQLVFWYNNNREIIAAGGYETYDASVTLSTTDNSDSSISLRRDLEDFARLDISGDSWLIANAFNTAGPGQAGSNQLSVTYRLTLENGGGATINLFPAATLITNGIQHVSSDVRAQSQIDNFATAIATSIGQADLVLAGAIDKFLFEAKGNGLVNSQLVFTTVVQYPDNSTTQKRQVIDLELRNFEDFYTRYEIDYTSGSTDLRKDLTFQHFATPTTPVHASQVRDTPFVGAHPNEDEDHIVFVHGWNVEHSANIDFKKAAAETLFKRMFWQGFRGHFVEFDWPTTWDAEGSRNWSAIPGFAENLTYNAGEFQAYRSGRGLMQVLDSLDGDKHLLAHSMGNVVVAEALRQWNQLQPTNALVKNYVAMEAAISTGAYGDMSSDAFEITVSTQSYGNFGWPHEVFDESRVDLLRQWHDGFPGGSSTHYMASAESAAGKWINLYNPDDVATSLAWKGNNLIKHFLNHENPALPDLPGGVDEVVWGALMWQFEYDINSDLWVLMPPPDIWPWRYVVQYDEINGHKYFRVPHPIENTLVTNPNDWTELTSGLVDANGEPGALAYEIMAFMSQANAAPLGTKALPVSAFNFVNEDIKFLGIDPTNTESIYYSGHVWNHSFQFHHDAAATWQFWQKVKQETSFDATY
jgi:hypothetical protein